MHSEALLIVFAGSPHASALLPLCALFISPGHYYYRRIIIISVSIISILFGLAAFVVLLALFVVVCVDDESSLALFLVIARFQTFKLN